MDSRLAEALLEKYFLYKRIKKDYVRGKSIIGSMKSVFVKSFFV